MYSCFLSYRTWSGFRRFKNAVFKPYILNHISKYIEKACTVTSFLLPPLCSILSKLRFPLYCAPKCRSRFVHRGVVSLSRVHQRLWNKRYFRNSENQKMLGILFFPIPPLVTPELWIEKDPKPDLPLQWQVHVELLCILVGVLGGRC